jgi:hypothetical protein
MVAQTNSLSLTVELFCIAVVFGVHFYEQTPGTDLHHTAPSHRVRRARGHLQLATPDLGTRIAVTLSIFTFKT